MSTRGRPKRRTRLDSLRRRARPRVREVVSRDRREGLIKGALPTRALCARGSLRACNGFETSHGSTALDLGFNVHANEV
jgi:hypothetical protein